MTTQKELLAEARAQLAYLGDDKHTNELVSQIDVVLAQQEGQSNYCPQCEELGRELAALKAQPEQPDLDAICQDLQEKTYNQAMRIAELEAQPEQRSVSEHGEPVAEKVYDQEDDTAYIQYFIPHDLIPIGTLLYATPPPVTLSHKRKPLTDERELILIDGVEYTVPPQVAAEILRLHIANKTKRQRLSGLGKAAIGRKHFGNPIPQEWYAAADDLEAAHGIKE